MRTGFNGGWLEENGRTIGISLGSDFCAEHEWGIKGLKRRLGIDGAQGDYSREKPKYTKPHGLPRRMITKHDVVRLYEYKKAVILLCLDPWSFDNIDKWIAEKGIAKAWKDIFPRDLPQRDLGTAWSGDDFGIYGEGDHVERIKELHAAFQADNVGIWIAGTTNPFERGGLILCIADRVAPEHVQSLKDNDLEVERLQDASDATGIVKRLNEAKKGFFACSPRWFNKEFKPGNEEKKSAHPVIYWLNPMEQNQNHFGWFTVEELDQWIAGTGPVPMQKEKKA